VTRPMPSLAHGTANEVYYQISETVNSSPVRGAQTGYAPRRAAGLLYPCPFSTFDIL